MIIVFQTFSSISFIAFYVELFDLFGIDFSAACIGFGLTFSTLYTFVFILVQDHIFMDKFFPK